MEFRSVSAASFKFVIYILHDNGLKRTIKVDIKRSHMKIKFYLYATQSLIELNDTGKKSTNQFFFIKTNEKG